MSQNMAIHQEIVITQIIHLLWTKKYVRYAHLYYVNPHKIFRPWFFTLLSLTLYQIQIAKKWLCWQKTKCPPKLGCFTSTLYYLSGLQWVGYAYFNCISCNLCIQKCNPLITKHFLHSSGPILWCWKRHSHVLWFGWLE